MRFTIVGPAYPLRGGIAHHTYWLRQQLASRGHDVQVVSFSRLYPALLFPGTTEQDASRLKFDAGALPLLAPLSPAAWRKAIRATKAFAPDVIVFQWWQPFFGPMMGMLARAFKRAGLRQIVECHNVFPHEGTPLDRSLLRFAFASVDAFITHSLADQKRLAGVVGQRRIHMSPLPRLDEFAGAAAPARDGRRLLFFGKVRRYKGLDVLLRALPKALEKVKCELLVVGEFYDSVERYQRLISELGIEPHVRIDNRYVANEEVADIFARADALVLPYLSASSSGVAQIAAANALPVIASTAGGLAEAVIDNVTGLLFPAGDADALAARIVNYFTQGLGPAFAANLRESANDASRCSLIEILEAAAREQAGASTVLSHSL
jgi:glycosyltransferase involved in cell wall biosynthesis